MTQIDLEGYFGLKMGVCPNVKSRCRSIYLDSLLIGSDDFKSGVKDGFVEQDSTLFRTPLLYALLRNLEISVHPHHHRCCRLKTVLKRVKIAGADLRSMTGSFDQIFSFNFTFSRLRSFTSHDFSQGLVLSNAGPWANSRLRAFCSKGCQRKGFVQLFCLHPYFV